MKKYCIIFLTFVIITITAFGLSSKNPNVQPSDYLRIHVRADSNDSSAQAVKYLVRDDVVAYLTPLVTSFETRDEAVVGVRARLNDLARVASATLARNGLAYGATAELKTERFPTRVYGEYTLPSGEYVALILRLGRGEGDNWWCVVYPPLCFAGKTGNVVYESKIAELIRKWKK